MALGLQTWSNDVSPDMPSPPFDSTHDRTTSGVAYNYRLKAAQTIKQRQAWHDITALGLHARSDYVGTDLTSLTLDNTHG